MNLNSNAQTLCDQAVAAQRQLGINLVHADDNGRIIDFGVDVSGSIEAGILLARICLADLATVEVGCLTSPHFSSVCVETGHPLLACMGSQYAGWQIQRPDFVAMGSGPARALLAAEKVIQQYRLREQSSTAVLVLESNAIPDSATIDHLRSRLGEAVQRLDVCVAPTASLAGTVQIVARSVESACHKLFELGFDLGSLRAGRGVAPLLTTRRDEPGADALAMGRCNDAILFGGSVLLHVDCDDSQIEAVGPRTPSSASPQFGVPFGKLLREVRGDFYQLDPMLFAPACIEFQNHRTGNPFRYGQLDWGLLPELRT